VPRFSRPLREAGKFADISTNREGKKPGRARLQSCRQAAPMSPASVAAGLPEQMVLVERTLLSVTLASDGALHKASPWAVGSGYLDDWSRLISPLLFFRQVVESLVQPLLAFGHEQMRN
jgi:hypothetical protein